MFNPNQYSSMAQNPQNWMPNNYGFSNPQTPNNQFYGNSGMRNYNLEQNQSPMQYNQQPMVQQPLPNVNQPINQQPVNNSTGFNGRIVDGIDMVKAIDVPYGSYGVFPRADMKEIYVKCWNPNGTTSTVIYNPIAPSDNTAQMKENDNTVPNDFVVTILSRMNVLEEKIDSLLEPKMAPEQPKEALF